MCSAWSADHQYGLPLTKPQQDIMDASSVQTLPSQWLCRCAEERQTGCQSDKDHVWSRLLDWSQTGCQQTQPKNPACTTTTRQESSKETGCLPAEQQETSLPQWYLQPFRCNATQFREKDWTVFRNAVYSSSVATLGHTSRKHQDWFDENDDEIQGLLEENHRIHKAHQDDTSSVSKKAACNNICKTVQSRLRDMLESWLSKKAEEIQSVADRKDMKKFHDALQTVYGPKSSGTTPLLSAGGITLLTDMPSWKSGPKTSILYL